ncbi:MAG TPA: ABATE domain-containing protein [Acidimicrobiia bacterium]|nr:ABATE domain-containing protein [Acidimicrobiia bacterium]
MNFAHYGDRPAQLAVDLVNTYQTDRDEIGTLGELELFLGGFQDLRPLGGASPTRSDLSEVRSLRDKLRQVFDSADEATAMGHLNDILAESGASPRISMHDGEPHLHYEPMGSSVTAWMAATTAMALAGVLVEHGVTRFGSCRSGTCRDVFIDTTRNRSRIHCGSSCATREAVAAYRRRQATHG